MKRLSNGRPSQRPNFPVLDEENAAFIQKFRDTWSCPKRKQLATLAFSIPLAATSRVLGRLLDMSESSQRPSAYQSETTTLSQTDARQGRTGLGVRYVLAISLGAGVILLAIAYLLIGY